MRLADLPRPGQGCPAYYRACHQRALTEFAKHGIFTVDDLSSRPMAEVRALPRIGIKALNAMREAMLEAGVYPAAWPQS